MQSRISRVTFTTFQGKDAPLIRPFCSAPSRTRCASSCGLKGGGTVHRGQLVYLLFISRRDLRFPLAFYATLRVLRWTAILTCLSGFAHSLRKRRTSRAWLHDLARACAAKLDPRLKAALTDAGQNDRSVFWLAMTRIGTRCMTAQLITDRVQVMWP